ncbi:MAG TPA: hypothetical protein VJI69_01825, partial [Bacteroidia bacterium]|nr:hypothetical protein [Bacteroidia bacterium]
MKKVNILLVLAAVSVLAFGFIKNDSAPLQEVVGTNVGNRAPELNFKSPGDKDIALSSLKGKIV